MIKQWKRSKKRSYLAYESEGVQITFYVIDCYKYIANPISIHVLVDPLTLIAIYVNFQKIKNSIG